MFKTQFHLLLVLLSASPAMANVSPEQEFCDVWVKSTEQKKKDKEESIGLGKVLGFLLRFSYSKSSVVRAIPLNAALNQSETARAVRFGEEKGTIYSVGLSEQSLSDLASFEARQDEYKKAEKQLASDQKTLKKLIRKTKTQESCMKALQESGLDFEAIRKNAEYIQLNARVKMEGDNQTIDRLLKKQDRRYRGLTMVSAVTNDRLSKQLKTQETPIAVLALHASEDGKLYDSNWNLIPRSIFQQMSPAITTLVIYACHSQSVIERYRLKELAADRNIQVIYPEVGEKSQWILGDSVPVQIFGSYLKQSLQKATRSADAFSVETSPQQCRFEVPTHSIFEGELGVMLNQTYIGMVSKAHGVLEFDCKLLSAKNTVTLQGMNLFQKPKLDCDVLSWAASLNGQSIEIKHYFDIVDATTYVGSKGVLGEKI